MAEVNFTVTDYFELNALSKALHEARYHENPNSELVAGSPFVAEMHARVLAELFRHDNTPEKKKNEWLAWSNREYENRVVKKHLVDCNWNNMSAPNQLLYVETLVKPFEATKEEIDELIRFANSHHSIDSDVNS